jgi:hypothetical protein
VGAVALSVAAQVTTMVATTAAEASAAALTAVSVAAAIPVAPVIPVIVIGVGIVAIGTLFGELIKASAALDAAQAESARLDMIRMNMQMVAAIPVMIAYAMSYEEWRMQQIQLIINKWRNTGQTPRIPPEKDPMQFLIDLMNEFSKLVGEEGPWEPPGSSGPTPAA